MRCRRAAVFVAAIMGAVALIAAPAAHAGLEPYGQSNDPMATTPSTDESVFGAWHNPAAWAIPEHAMLDVGLFSDVVDGHRDDILGWQAGFGRGLGFGVKHLDSATFVDSTSIIPVVRRRSPSETQYQIALSSRSGPIVAGVAWHIYDTNGYPRGRSNFLSLGHIFRPSRRLSFGWVSEWAPSVGDHQHVLDIGWRPLGTPRLTLFADYPIRRWFEDANTAAGVGASLRPFEGLEVSGKWRRAWIEENGFRDSPFQISAGLNFMHFGARATSAYTYSDHRAEHTGTWYVARLQPPTRGIDLEKRHRNTLAMNLRGHVVYQPYRWFDGDSKALRDLTEQTRFAKEDPTVGAVAIRLSGFSANAAMVWELRESLLALKRAGKKVYIAADNLDQRTYYLASVADRLIIDPLAGLLMPGVQASRTYMKDLLEKMGLGFDEWRFYKYKSALETFSRTSFSEADREQYDALVRATYDEFANGIATTGRVTRERFDQIVNEEPYLRAHRLVELGLADTLGRWEDLEKIVRADGRRKPQPYAPLAKRRWQPDETWGPTPTVAIVYLVGDCAMDSGIKARTTAPAMRRLRESKDVRGVALRVDSPGGDPLASDLVAEETRRLKAAKKPVLVSQGRVAGSGGYWISMDGDSINAGPFTLTGSIGIIGGWVWNDGFGKKTGLTSDRVQVGHSADLLGGLTVPFLGATLPERNLDEGERRLIQRNFADLYDTFVGRVASGRNIPEARVRELAEGHVYGGRAALGNGLVDRMATFEETVESLKARLKPARHQKVRVVEIPARPLIKWPRFFPGVRAAFESRTETPIPARLLETSVLQQLIDRPGQPLLLTPGSLLPLEEAVPSPTAR